MFYLLADNNARSRNKEVIRIAFRDAFRIMVNIQDGVFSENS